MSSVRFPRALALASLLLPATAATFAAATVPAPGPPITVEADLRDAPRNLVHARLTIPAAPGPLTLYYPQWVPGEHGPTGPLAAVAGLTFAAGGQPLAWHRDPADMYAFHLQVPAGASAVEATIDYVAPVTSGSYTAGPSTTAELAVLSWNDVMLYPGGPAATTEVAPAVILPVGWRYATALEGAVEEQGRIRFAPVSLERLIDSPLQAGAHLRRVAIPGGDRPHAIDLASDSAEAIVPPAGFEAGYGRLVAEAGALFGSRHYRHYDWLLTMSDHVASFGLEHHESSDDRVGERGLLDEARRRLLISLLTHEYVHSWNGKYRRPEGLVRTSYQQPYDTSLLWVYEGLTQYLQEVLPARAGLWPLDYGRERLAQIAANLEYQAGRRWRPLEDTAVAAQTMRGTPSHWRSWRRSTDYYDESVLVWMEVDATLRTASKGARSLDDFCRAFFGGPEHGPEVRSYSRQDVEAALGAVAPGDWHGLLERRLATTGEHAPLGGLEAAGWKLVFDGKPNAYLADREKAYQFRDWSYSLGLVVGRDDEISDVRVGSPADRAGVAPGSKVIAVDGLAFSRERLADAIASSPQRQGPIELLLRQGEVFRTVRLDYHDGPRYPHLERTTAPDLLTRIQAPRAAATAAPR